MSDRADGNDILIFSYFVYFISILAILCIEVKNLKKIVVAVCIGLCITIGLTLYSQALQEDIAQNILRLHVLANSDSEKDQYIKLCVRDRLLEESQSLFINCTTPAQSQAVFLREKENLQKVAMEEIKRHGCNYPVSLSLEKTYFPTRYYQNIALPAGEYDAVRVEIGTAQGQNWWCVMFPPLCFVDESVDSEAESKLTAAIGEDAAILTPTSGTDVRVRFKVVDFFQSATHVLKQALERI